MVRQGVLPPFRSLYPEQIVLKSDSLDLVITANLTSEASISKALSDLFPDSLTIGLEALAFSPWLVDKNEVVLLCFLMYPIAGTWNYAERLATFGSIFIATRFAQSIFGVLYNLLKDYYMIAKRGLDAARSKASCGVKKSLKTSVRGAVK